VKAAELIEAGELKLPAAVLTSRQTAGRGQRGNSWWSDRGTLTVTFALASNDSVQAGVLPLIAGLAVRDAVSRWVDPSRLSVKWPNDLLADGRKKLAGVLCERVRGADLIGIGVNVLSDLSQAPTSVRQRAASMAQLCDEPPTLETFFAELAKRITSPTSGDDWLSRLSECHALTHRPIVVDTGSGMSIAGVCRGVDVQGRLLVENESGTHSLLSGTVTSF
jgi:BirA family biotin operon repressor/biotin-[acetyl-CoA-carboxylase] ligase